jgi:WD40 repeat protein
MGAGASADRKLKVLSQDRIPHDNRIITTSIAADGLIATGGWNSEVRLWRVQPLQSSLNKVFDQPEQVVPVAVLPHQNRVRFVRFAPSGEQLVTIQTDGLVRLWHLRSTDQQGYSLNVEAGGSLVKRVDAEHWMISGLSQWNGHMSNAAIYPFRSNEFVGGMKGWTRQTIGHLLDSACSPDRSQLVTTHAGPSRSGQTFGLGQGKGGGLRFWSLPHGEPQGELIPLPSEPRCVTFRPDGKQIAVCTARMEILFFDAETRLQVGMIDTYGSNKSRLRRNFLFPQNPVNEVVDYLPDGKTLIAWSTRKPGLCVWDVASGELKFPQFAAADPALADVAISPNGRFLAMAGGQSTLVRMVDLETGEVLDPEFQHPSYVHAVEFSPDGNQIITGCRDGKARVFDWRTGRVRLDQLSHDGDVVAASFTPDSNFLLTLGLDNQMRVWHASDGSLAASPRTVPAGSTQLLVSDDSRYAIAAGGQIRVVDLVETRQTPAINLDQAREISELLANKIVVNGELVVLSAEQWLARWKAYASKRRVGF